MPSFDPVEQLYARSQAVEIDPALHTPQGRANREIMLTFGALARRENPRTILGAFIMTGQFDYPAIEEGEGLTVSRIAARANIDPIDYDYVFPTKLILDDLVEVGILRYDAPNPDTVEGILRNIDRVHEGRPTYLLNMPKQLQIERLDPEADARQDSEYQRWKSERPSYAPTRDSLIRRWRSRRWVKKQRKGLGIREL